MKRILCSMVAGALLCAMAGSAQAGPATEAMGVCFKASTSKADRHDMALWILSALAARPDTVGVLNFTEEQKTDYNRRVAALFGRLLTVDCRAATMAALQTDGKQAIEAGFGMLGEAAGEELYNNSEVDKAVSEMVKYVPQSTIEAVGQMMLDAKK